MKILFVQPTGDKQGHYGVYTTHVCQELAKQGNDVVLFTNAISPEKYLTEKPFFSTHIVNEGRYGFTKFDALKKRYPPLYTYGYLRNSFFIFREALRYASKNKGVDVIQVTDVEFGILSILLWWHRKNLPRVVVLFHAANFSFEKYIGSPLMKSYKVFQKQLVKHRLGKEISGIVTLGEYHEKNLIKQLNLPKTFPISVIYDGSDPPEKTLTKEEARKSLGINYSGTIFLFFGMLRKDKGIEYFLQALSGMKDDQWRAIIAGSPFDYTGEEISKLLEDYSITDKVISHIKYILSEDVPLYFFAADAIVLPYRKIYTGGSGPLLKEAAVYKRPAIVSNVSEMGYLVQKYFMGYVCNPEDDQDLREKLQAFLKLSSDERAILGENAFQAANSWSKMGREYVSFYEILTESV
ncbi:MAG: glycosyltransferase family 4 protein [bacterium]|nr:glycosyltransferase family 4 protein [bacterium]